MNVLAIWITKTGCPCPKCRAERNEYRAAVNDGRGERQAFISDRDYSDLSDRAGVEDYRDGSYIAFARPVEWEDVISEDRVP